ncbi:putative phosphoribosylaminoimidazole carboxylase ATPase subunit [Proteus penneri ATCC 35198]|nr:putative phosphoribosylaminoimidazole carboxylase ATPase subunit [Proteus penneri ATCC 35198]
MQSPKPFPIKKSIITAEIERWPETSLTKELERHTNFVNRDIFSIACR